MAHSRRTVPAAIDAIWIEDGLRFQFDSGQVAKIGEWMREIAVSSRAEVKETFDEQPGTVLGRLLQ